MEMDTVVVKAICQLSREMMGQDNTTPDVYISTSKYVYVLYMDGRGSLLRIILVLYSLSIAF